MISVNINKVKLFKTECIVICTLFFLSLSLITLNIMSDSLPVISSDCRFNILSAIVNSNFVIFVLLTKNHKVRLSINLTLWFFIIIDSFSILLISFL